MLCEKCGAECKDGAKFCSKCGAPLKSGIPKNDTLTPPVDSEDSAATGAGGWFQHHKKIAWIILIVIVAAVIVIVAVSVARHASRDVDMSPEERLDLGIRYYEDGDYQEAVTELTAVLDVEQNMQAYRYLADAYLDLDETDLAGDVYEEAIAYALDTYEQTGDLPEGTVDMYDAATAYGKKYGDVPGMNDLAPIIASKDDPVKGSVVTNNMQKDSAPSIEDVEELLDRIRYNCAEDLYLFYNLGDDNISNYNEIDADEALSWVGYSLDESDEMALSDTKEHRLYYDGKFYQEGELSSEQEPWAEDFYVFPTAYYEEALTDMFGYELEDYNLKDVSYIEQDSDGNYYIEEVYFRGDIFPIQNVTMSIEYISEEPDQEGDYIIIAKYEGNNVAGGIDQSSYVTYFMQFRLRPDQNSKYGYVIAGMTPAGDGEVDEEYRSMVKDSDDSDVVEVPGDYLCSYSSDRLITDADLAEIKAGDYGALPAGKSLEQMIINEIYAKHGYQFTTPEIQAYFDGKSWYQEIGSYESDMSVVESRLSSIEKQNVDYLNNK